MSRVGEVSVRPWGRYEVVAESRGWLVKRLTVSPGSRLSLQAHAHRAETWVCTAGTGIAHWGDSPDTMTSTRLVPGAVTQISAGWVRRLECDGDVALEIVEVQLGVCREDDTLRIQDDYDRA